MKLYDYFRSGAAFRTRIALNLKELEYEQISIDLSKPEGDQFSAEYTELNPQNLVPTLIDGDMKLIQSMAIMEYLEETYPEPRILPGSSIDRAQIRALANVIACDVHPLNNLRVRLYLVDDMGVTEENRKVWIEHWIKIGLSAYEKIHSEGRGGIFSYGDVPSMADACLIPQMANARLNNCDLSGFSTLLRIEEACLAHPAFEKALPANQPHAS